MKFNNQLRAKSIYEVIRIISELAKSETGLSYPYTHVTRIIVYPKKTVCVLFGVHMTQNARQ